MGAGGFHRQVVSWRLREPQSVTMCPERDEDEWFEISEDLWLDPNRKPKKLKLCSDASVPQPIIDELRDAGIPVLTVYEADVATHADETILAWSRRNNRVLLTMDRDFWNGQKFPLHTVPGLIFLDVPPEDIDGALETFGLIYGTFASSYSLDWWESMKARATPSGYFLKMRNWEGRILQYEIKLEEGILFARELN
jgi:hypothetical protein